MIHWAARWLWAIGILVLCSQFLWGQTAPSHTDLRGQVIDENGAPVARAEMAFKEESGQTITIYTDAAGHYDAPGMVGTSVLMSVSKPGFFKINDRRIDLTAGNIEIEVTLNHETEIQEKVEVQSAPIEIDPDTTSHQESLVQHEILDVPVASSHDLQESLKVMPQVVTDSLGNLHVAGARQGQTEVLLDGFEINDPGTGAFNSRINVDAVREVTIETGGYGAEYAHAGAGILALDTQAGDDKLRFGVTNFVPDVSLQQGLHLGNWYPRAMVSGPIKKGKVWFSDALSLQHSFVLVPELPQGQNTDVPWSGDNLFRMQANLSSRNILQGSFLINAVSDPRLGIGPFSPISTSVNQEVRRYFVSVKDQIWAGKTLFDIGAAIDTGHTNLTPQGTAPYVEQPSASSGSFFETLRQSSQRAQLLGDVTSGELEWHGKHTISAGFNLATIDFSQQASRGEIDFESAVPSPGSPPADTATFSGSGLVQLSNTQLGAYLQDLWHPVKQVVISAGVRVDYDRNIESHIVEPRLAMNWVPKGDGRMKFTLAWGEHYQPISMSTFSLGWDQSRTDAFAATATQMASTTVTRFSVPLASLEEPRSYNTMAEWDERIMSNTFVGASFLLREYREGFAWELQGAFGQPSVTYVLQNNRDDRYIAGEMWVRHSFKENTQIELDYTRSRASSNEVLDPTLLALSITPQEPGPLAWDSPNRLVSTGWTPLPIWGLFLSEFLEYRTGLPFSVINDRQQLVEPANDRRYPDYFSLNVGLEKRFKFRGHEWAARLTCVNVTANNNANVVVDDIQAPNFLAIAGSQRRAITARLRLVTEK